ncbi:hypothetical protein M4D79_16350 [Mycolicibacterium novocastrense]|nr:hypothetical protein M4D79_16350 [Mycolicibacterium novocastrense]
MKLCRFITRLVRPLAAAHRQPVSPHREHADVEPAVLIENPADRCAYRVTSGDRAAAQTPSIDVEEGIGVGGHKALDIVTPQCLPAGFNDLGSAILDCQSAVGGTDPLFGVRERGLFILDVELAQGRNPVVPDFAGKEESPRVHLAVVSDCLAFDAADAPVR